MADHLHSKIRSQPTLHLRHLRCQTTPIPSPTRVVSIPRRGARTLLPVGRKLRSGRPQVATDQRERSEPSAGHEEQTRGPVAFHGRLVSLGQERARGTACASI